MRIIDKAATLSDLRERFGGQWRATNRDFGLDRISWLNEELKASLDCHKTITAILFGIKWSYLNSAGVELFRRQAIVCDCGIIKLIITKDTSEEMLAERTDDSPALACNIEPYALFQGLRIEVIIDLYKEPPLVIEVACCAEAALLIKILTRTACLGASAAEHCLTNWVKLNVKE